MQNENEVTDKEAEAERSRVRADAAAEILRVRDVAEAARVRVELVEATRADGSRWILENIVTTNKGYYDLSRRQAFSTDKKLDAFYGEHRIDGETAAGNHMWVYPSTQLKGNSDKLTATGMCWNPVKKKDFKPILWYGGVEMINTYVPLDIEPLDMVPTEWLRLVKYICGEYADYVLDHMAFTVQHPDRKIAWQILIIGKPRTGKTAIAMPMVHMHGENASIVKGDDVKTGWGQAFYQKKFVLIEEVYDYDAKMWNTIKPKLSNYGVEHLNMKYGDMLAQLNVYSIIMLTNKAAPFQMDEDEGKLLVIKAPDGKIFGESEKSSKFYKELHESMDQPEHVGATYHYLMNRDVSGFSAGILPVRTPALLAACKAGRSDYAAAMEDMIDDEDHPFDKKTFKLKEARTALAADGYKAGLKGIKEALEKLGYREYNGQKWVAGKNKQAKFWAKVEDCESMSTKELYKFQCGLHLLTKTDL